MDEEDANVPDRETCEQLIKDFQGITAANSAVAQMFLQDSEWNLEKAVPAFYEALASEDDVQVVEVVPATPDAVVEQLFGEGMTVTNKPPPKLKLLTWNLDGLDDRSLKQRMKSVVQVLQQVQPDVVFFQEVIEEVAGFLEKKLPEYNAIRGSSEGYFNMTLLRVFTIKYDSHKVVPFVQSSMGRHALECRAHVGERHFILYNTHLESCKEFSQERVNQLQTAFKHLAAVPPEVTIVVGGDLNLRDPEATCVPGNYLDAWKACGSRSELRWTWDTMRNTNRGLGGPKGGPRARFDRVYIRPEARRVKCVDFGLVGARRAFGTQMFPSDHWGLLVALDLLH